MSGSGSNQEVVSRQSTWKLNAVNHRAQPFCGNYKQYRPECINSTIRRCRSLKCQLSQQPVRFRQSSSVWLLCKVKTSEAVSRLRRLVAGFLLCSRMFEAWPVHVGFVVNKEVLWHFTLQVLQFPPVSIIPPKLHTNSFIYRTRYIIFFSQCFSFPCQYHSTIAPYSFIHLPPTLCNVFLPVLHFPLSVSFHQCSIPIIHPPPTTHNLINWQLH